MELEHLEKIQLKEAEEESKRQIEEAKKAEEKKKEAAAQLNPASKILEEEFQKNQEFFKLKLSDLKIEKQIGAGASAEVFKGTYKEADVAIKKLRLFPQSAENTLKEFQREVSTLTQVRHPNLVLFMGAR